jgi:DNA polymerase-1
MASLLLDGHNLLYRAFTSLPSSITDSNGDPVNGVYGLLSALLKMSRELSATHIVVAFDDPTTPTFRHRLFAGYQAQRGPLGGDRADDFQRQVSVARSVLPEIGVPAPCAPGFEADDILGTVALTMGTRDQPAIIVSTDRDLLQLVRPGVEVLTPGSSGIHARTAEDVRVRLGIAPEGVTTFKALAGDGSDNIPGVKGIGSKTAAQLVNQFGSLESIFDNLSHLPSRVATALQAQRVDAFLYRRIVTIVTDVELTFNPLFLPPVLFAREERARSILDRFQT